MKNVLIIGANSTIAIACSRLWAEQGANFFLVGRNNEKLKQTAADLETRGAKNVVTYIMDAADFSAHSKMLETCLLSFRQIDIALIAHGTLPDQKTCEQRVDVALQEFTNNGTSVIALLTVLANHFEIQRCGALAVISSVAGDRGRQSNYLYGTAKAAVSTFCEGLRARLFKVGVHVMTIKPGFVDTPMTRELSLPPRLVASPDKVALQITRGIQKNVDTLYTPGAWAIVMFIIKMIPSLIFKRLSL
ncbi:SDR family oxidoreductase [Pseudomonas sp. PB120]|uniref:SDR family oxidoreductase n=1 Tax=Pseudomonas sp. PB120 TaxID=2494700 RepID=UPI0012FE3D3C|nr:SDR family oxidoreductase [Pseudomonas sp. PB120]MVV48172.1 SDR family oxidoreductase [Pseudomonas sp. PB120]